jgi:hypothetical protein
VDLAALLLTMVAGGSRAGAAQDDVDEGRFEFGVGLYLSNCDSLVEGTALFDLGDAELATEDFENTDENDEDTDESAEEDGDLEDEIEQESSGDETDVEEAIGSEDENDESENVESGDEEVVTPADALAVYVSISDAFDANLADLVDAPFAVAVRMGTEGEADTDGEGGNDFIACGEFGGAVAGNEIVIPLEALNDSGISGVAILARGEGEDESFARTYLFGQPLDSDGDETNDVQGDETDQEDEETDEGEG